jgi:hypothetical protein
MSFRSIKCKTWTSKTSSGCAVHVKLCNYTKDGLLLQPSFVKEENKERAISNGLIPDIKVNKVDGMR